MRYLFFSFCLMISFPLLGQVKIIRDAKTNKAQIQVEPLKLVIERFDPFVWKSEIPSGCPFRQSTDFSQIRFLGVKSGFHVGDTFYPSWADDDLMYSPWTDGITWRLDGSWERSNSALGENATTGHAVMEGDDPLSVVVYSLGIDQASARPYQGRYPCGSLVYNGIWYYGTYCLGPAASAQYGDLVVNWPWLGPFVGFRISTDKGLTWKDCPHTPEKSIFGETGINGYPVRIKRR